MLGLLNPYSFPSTLRAPPPVQRRNWAPIEPNAGYPFPLIRKYKREHHFFLINLFTKSEIAEVLGAVHGQGPGELCTWDR